MRGERGENTHKREDIYRQIEAECGVCVCVCVWWGVCVRRSGAGWIQWMGSSRHTSQILVSSRKAWLVMGSSDGTHTCESSTFTSSVSHSPHCRTTPNT